MFIRPDGWEVVNAEAGDEDASVGGGGILEAFGKTADQIFAERDARISGNPIVDSGNQGKSGSEDQVATDGEQAASGGDGDGGSVVASESNKDGGDPPDSDWTKGVTGSILESYGLPADCFKDEAAALRTIDQVRVTREKRQKEYEDRIRQQQEQQQLAYGDQGPRPRFPTQQQVQPVQSQQNHQSQQQDQQQHSDDIRGLLKKVQEVDFGGEMNALVGRLVDKMEAQEEQLRSQSRYLGYIQEQELRSFEDTVLRTASEVGGKLIDKDKVNALFGLNVPESQRSDQQRKAIGILMTNAAGYMTGNFGTEKQPLSRNLIETILVKHVPDVRVDVEKKARETAALQKQAKSKMGSGSGSRMIVNAPVSSRNPNDMESRAPLHAAFNDYLQNGRM